MTFGLCKMRQVEGRVSDAEYDDYDISDSESGLHPRYKDPSMPADMLFSADGQHRRPSAGLIFMCCNQMKKSILRYRVLRMPIGRNWVKADRVRPGAILFIFEYEARLLWGVYEVTSYPHFCTEGDAYRDGVPACPYQLYFRVHKQCKPLPERVFRKAIQDNYYAPFKFNFELREDQVAKLMKMFSFQKSIGMKVHHRAVSGAPNVGRFQRVDNLDYFPSAGDEILKSYITRGPYDRSFRNFKQVVPSSYHWDLKGDQLSEDIVQSEHKLHSCAGNLRTAFTSYPNTQSEHCLLKDDALSCDLKLGRAETFLEGNPGNRHMKEPGFLEGYPQKQGLIHFLKDSPVSLIDGTLREPKSMEGSFKDEDSLCNLTLQFNDSAVVRELDCADKPVKKWNLLNIASQGDAHNDAVELVNAVHTRQVQDSASSQPTFRKESFLVVDGDGSFAIHNKLMEKMQWITHEDLESCSTQLAPSLPSSAFSSPVVVRAAADRNHDVHTWTHNFIEILDHNVTSVPSKNSIHPSYLTVPDDKAWLVNIHDEADSLVQKEGIVEDDAHERNELVEANQIENQVQMSLRRILGKQSRFRSGSKIPADGGLKGKQSVWLRLSDPRQATQNDIFLANQDFCDWQKSGHHHPVSSNEDLESQKSMVYGLWKERPWSLQETIGFELGEGISNPTESLGEKEEEFVIDFKRRKNIFTHTDPSARPDHDVVTLESNEKIQTVMSRNSNPLEEDDKQKVRRRIKRPVLNGDMEAANDTQLSKDFDNVIMSALQALREKLPNRQ